MKIYFWIIKVFFEEVLVRCFSWSNLNVSNENICKCLRRGSPKVKQNKDKSVQRQRLDSIKFNWFYIWDFISKTHGFFK